MHFQLEKREISAYNASRALIGDNMLIRFGVKNFKSLHDYQEINFVASSLKDDEDGLIDRHHISGRRMLPAAIIYGANASGKSNFIDALSFLRAAIKVSHPEGQPGSGVPRKCFALDDEGKSNPTRVDADFFCDGIRYHYGFEANDESFISEWLYAFPAGRRQMLFERSGPKEISFGRALKGRNRVIADLMRENSLFVSTALQNNHEEITHIMDFFLKIKFSKNISVEGRAISNRFRKTDVDQRTIDFLQRSGTGITGFKRVERKRDEEEIHVAKEFLAFFSKLTGDVASEKEVDETSVSIELEHRGVNNTRVFFDPDNESAGTRRLLFMVSSAFKAIDEGSLFVVDEVDASLHTQVCETFLAIFNNKTINVNGAQILATTHDTNLMQSKVLRRDQVWFAEKNLNGATSIYPLSDINTRRGDNIEKGYLEGRFGAIPFPGSVDELLKGVK